MNIVSWSAMDVMLGGLLVLLQVTFGFGSAVTLPTPNNSSLRCSQCFHVTFSPKVGGVTDTINEDCLKEGDDYTHEEFLTCAPDVTHCRKVVGKATLMYKGNKIIADINARECAGEGNETVCRNDDFYIKSIFEAKGASVVSVEAQTCFCDWDMCNHGNHITHNCHLWGFILIILAIYFK